MNAWTGSGLYRLLFGWAIYLASLVNISLFYAWWSTHSDAIRTSGLFLAVLLGGTRVFRPEAFLGWERMYESMKTELEVRLEGLVFFTLAILLALGDKLSPFVAGGIFVLVICAVLFVSVLLHRSKRSTLAFVIGVAVLLLNGGLGILLIYFKSLPNLSGLKTAGLIAGGIGGALISLHYQYNRERVSTRDRDAAPPGEMFTPTGWGLPPAGHRRRDRRFGA